MTKTERIQNITVMLENAKVKRDEAIRAGRFQTANKWIAKVVGFQMMIKRIEQE